jgi:hypothetical protein
MRAASAIALIGGQISLDMSASVIEFWDRVWGRRSGSPSAFQGGNQGESCQVPSMLAGVYGISGIQVRETGGIRRLSGVIFFQPNPLYLHGSKSD